MSLWRLQQLEECLGCRCCRRRCCCCRLHRHGQCRGWPRGQRHHCGRLLALCEAMRGGGVCEAAMRAEDAAQRWLAAREARWCRRRACCRGPRRRARRWHQPCRHCCCQRPDHRQQRLPPQRRQRSCSWAVTTDGARSQGALGLQSRGRGRCQLAPRAVSLAGTSARALGAATVPCPARFAAVVARAAAPTRRWWRYRRTAPTAEWRRRRPSKRRRRRQCEGLARTRQASGPR